MSNSQQHPERLMELDSRLVASEQECEQLRTAFEDAEQSIGNLTAENAHLQNHSTRLSSENARLRHLLALNGPIS